MAEMPLIDADILAEARTAMPAKFAAICRYFIDDTESYLGALRAAVAEKSVQKLVIPAHSIKSSARQMGALRLGEIASELESLATGAVGQEAAADFARIARLVGTLAEVFGATRPLLERETAA